MKKIQGLGDRIILGLARVSTDDQAYKLALENQVQRLRDYGCKRIYADIGSRSDDAREGIASAIRDIEAGLVGELVVTRLDRLTSSPEMYERLIRLLKERHVPLVGTDEEINIQSEDGEFSAGIRIYIAKREVQVIRRRSQKGHESRRRKEDANVVLPWGYARSSNNKYKRDHSPFLCLLTDRPEDGAEFDGRTVDDLSKDVIAIFLKTGSLSKAVPAIHEKYGVQKISTVRGVDYRELSQIKKSKKTFVIEDDKDLQALKGDKRIRRRVFHWTHKGLRNWLYNPVLRGHTPYQIREFLGLDSAGRRMYGKTKPQELWDLRRNTHPNEVLLTEEQYQQIKSIIEFNGKTRGFPWVNGNDRRHPISGLLRCAACGAHMKSQATKVREGARRNYYKCKHAIAKTCDQRKTIRNDRAEAAIIAALTAAAERIDAFRQEPEQIIDPPELTILREQLLGLQTLGDNPAIEAARLDLKAQIARIERGLIQERINKTMKKEDALETLKHPHYWENRTDKEKIQLFRWLVDQVWVENGEVVKVDLQF